MLWLILCLSKKKIPTIDCKFLVWFSNKNANSFTLTHSDRMLSIILFFSLLVANWLNVYLSPIFHHIHIHIIFFSAVYANFQHKQNHYLEQMSGWNWSVHSGQGTSESMSSVSSKEVFTNGNEQRWWVPFTRHKSFAFFHCSIWYYETFGIGKMCKI